MRILNGIIVVSDATSMDAFIKECKSIGIVVSNIESSKHNTKRFRGFFYIQNNVQYESLIKAADSLTVNYALMDYTERLVGDDLIYL